MLDDAEGAPRPPNAAELQAIDEAMAAGDHQGAIDVALRACGGLTGGTRWNPALDQEADLDGETRAVTVGPAAFVDASTGARRSAGWLASTIAHEAIHLRQLLAVHPADGGDNYSRLDTGGDAVNEIEAYDWEIRNADRLQLPPHERAELVGRRQEHWERIRHHPHYAARVGAVAGGEGYDYWIDPADR